MQAGRAIITGPQPVHSTAAAADPSPAPPLLTLLPREQPLGLDNTLTAPNLLAVEALADSLPETAGAKAEPLDLAVLQDHFCDGHEKHPEQVSTDTNSTLLLNQLLDACVSCLLKLFA